MIKRGISRKVVWLRDDSSQTGKIKATPLRSHFGMKRSASDACKKANDTLRNTMMPALKTSSIDSAAKILV